MKKFLFLLFIETIICFNVIAQNEQNEQDEIESLKLELARLRNCNKFFSEHKGSVINHKYKQNYGTVELNPDSPLLSEGLGGFLKFCQDYSQEIVAYESNLENYTNVTGNHIVYSSSQRNGNAEINMYYEMVPQRPQTPQFIVINNDTKTTMSQRPQVLPFIVIDDDIEIKELEKQLNNIRNTKKLYQDLSGTLQHQMNYNLVETVDNAGDLLLKHVSIPQGDVLKEKAIEELRKKAGVENEKTTENKLAEFVNRVTDGSEKIIELVPGGDKLTNHYLWKLFKSTPEAGKGLGHLAAGFNIYFRKKEHDNKVQELDGIEQQLIKAIEEKRK